MPDAFDEELDKGPEGSIIQPIFLGCAAMGLGCLFSIGAIVIAIAVFFPGLVEIIEGLDEGGLMTASVPYLEQNDQVIERVGVPFETTIDDLDVVEGDDTVTYQIGDEIPLVTIFDITGPNGSARVESTGSYEPIDTQEWVINSIVVTFPEGDAVRVYPGETDVPPPPAQLAPPENETDGGAMPDVPDMPLDEEETPARPVKPAPTEQ